MCGGAAHRAGGSAPDRSRRPTRRRCIAFSDRPASHSATNTPSASPARSRQEASRGASCRMASLPASILSVFAAPASPSRTIRGAGDYRQFVAGEGNRPGSRCAIPPAVDTLASAALSAISTASAGDRKFSADFVLNISFFLSRFVSRESELLHNLPRLAPSKIRTKDGSQYGYRRFPWRRNQNRN
jgi:hypothetical protein